MRSLRRLQTISDRRGLLPAFRRAGAAAAALALACTVMLFIEPDHSSAAETNRRPAQPASAIGSGTGATQQTIDDAQARLAKFPSDRTTQKRLASALLQRVRETGDPIDFAAVDKILTGLGGARSSDPEVLVLEGTLLLARHDFRNALAVGKRALAALPTSPVVHGILVDAYNELGRYDDAAAATARMAEIRPDRSALARVSFAREIRGDASGAIVAMQQAVLAGQPTGENAAYVQTLLGDLLLDRGDVAGAESTFAGALRAFPGFAPARVGQAAVLTARGRPAQAATILTEVVATQPILEYVIAEGDAYAAAGMQDRATKSYQLVDAISALYRANKVDIDLDIAIYRADHDPTATLLDTTRRAVARRPSLVGHDALAWVLHRLGRQQEAAAEMAKVVAIGDRDPVFRYHAAVISDAVGDRKRALAELDLVLRSNPRALGIPTADLTRLAIRLGRTVPAPFA